MASLLKAVGLGATAMYFFDPQQGRRRRALLRDQCVHLMNTTQHTIDVTKRDLQNRMQGCIAEFSGALHGDEPVSDEKLVARVRSKLGRAVSHPSAIEVTADNGVITLSGPVLAREAANLVRYVGNVSGVSSVDNQLDVHENPGGIAALQGGSPKSGETWDVMQNNWSPTTRLAVGSGAAAVALYVLNRPVMLTCLASALGLVLMSAAEAGTGENQNQQSGHQGESNIVGDGQSRQSAGLSGNQTTGGSDEQSSANAESPVRAGEFS